MCEHDDRNVVVGGGWRDPALETPAVGRQRLEKPVLQRLLRLLPQHPCLARGTSVRHAHARLLLALVCERLVVVLDAMEHALGVLLAQQPVMLQVLDAAALRGEQLRARLASLARGSSGLVHACQLHLGQLHLGLGLALHDGDEARDTPAPRRLRAARLARGRGIGEMIELVARHLEEQQVHEIVIANRTQGRADDLAAQVGGRGIGLEELPVALEHADILISCTASPLPVLGKGTVERALKRRRHRPMFMVDIAVPRDIEPEVGELDDVYLYTVDHLQEAIQENVRARQEAAEQAGALIDEAIRRHHRSRREQRAVGVLRDYRRQGTELADQELQRALAQLEKGGDPEEVLRRFKHSLVNKWLHQPSVGLRRLAAEGRAEALAMAREILLDQDNLDDQPSDQESDQE